MKSIKLYIFICIAALIITGCSDGNSLSNKGRTTGSYSVNVNAAIPASKALFGDSAVSSILVDVYDPNDSNLINVGSGTLTKGDTNWSGLISVSMLGTVEFLVRAYNAGGELLYVDSGHNQLLIEGDYTQVTIPVVEAYQIPVNTSITIDGDETDWAAVTSMLTDTINEGEIPAGADIEYVKTAVNADGTRMSVLVKINGDIDQLSEIYRLEFRPEPESIDPYAKRVNVQWDGEEVSVDGWDEDLGGIITGLNGTGAVIGNYIEFSFDLLPLNLTFQTVPTFTTGRDTIEDGWVEDDNADTSVHDYASVGKAWKTLFNDNFQREDSATLGTGWLALYGSVSILDNELAIASGTSAAVGYGTVVSDSCVRISYVIRGSIATAYSGGAGAGARYNPETQSGYLAFINETHSDAYITKIVSNVMTPISTEKSFTPEAEASYFCEFILNGSTLTYTIKDGDGVVLNTMSAADTDYTGGLTGIFKNSLTGTLYIDDFKIESYK